MEALPSLGGMARRMDVHSKCAKLRSQFVVSYCTHQNVQNMRPCTVSCHVKLVTTSAGLDIVSDAAVSARSVAQFVSQ